MANGDVLFRTAVAPAARRIVRRQLTRWVQEARRLANPEDPEATHDYRVALRRLRTLLRAFRPWLGRIPIGTRLRLRRMMRATNDVRDLEVLHAWVTRETGSLTARQQNGAAWLAEQLRVRRANAEDRMLRNITRRSGPLRADLRKALAEPGRAARTPRRPVGNAGRALGRLVLQGALEIEKGLGSFHSMADRVPIHATRIAVKRLRYLLEPFAEAVSGAPELLVRLRNLQDQLGMVTDAHGAADEFRLALIEASADGASGLAWSLLPWPGPELGAPAIPPPPRGARLGLAALARRLRREGDAAFERLRSDWLGNSKDDLVRQVRDLARRIPVR